MHRKQWWRETRLDDPHTTSKQRQEYNGKHTHYPLTPVQHAINKYHDPLRPEKSLLLAVLYDAIECVLGRSPGLTAHQKASPSTLVARTHEIANAKWWLMRETSVRKGGQDGLSLPGICDYLGVSVRRLRQRMRELGLDSTSRIVRPTPTGGRQSAYAEIEAMVG